MTWLDTFATTFSTVAIVTFVGAWIAFGHALWLRWRSR